MAQVTPTRIRLRRTKGWRKPEGAIIVARPSRWGNMYRLAKPHEHYAPNTVVWADKWGNPTGDAWGGFTDAADATGFAVELFRRRILASLERNAGRAEGVFDCYLGPLVGHDLACWCVEGSACHADVLLELAANGTRP